MDLFCHAFFISFPFNNDRRLSDRFVIHLFVFRLSSHFTLRKKLIHNESHTTEKLRFNYKIYPISNKRSTGQPMKKSKQNESTKIPVKWLVNSSCFQRSSFTCHSITLYSRCLRCKYFVFKTFSSMFQKCQLIFFMLIQGMI